MEGQGKWSLKFKELRIKKNHRNILKSFGTVEKEIVFGIFFDVDQHMFLRKQCEWVYMKYKTRAWNTLTDYDKKEIGTHSCLASLLSLHSIRLPGTILFSWASGVTQFSLVFLPLLKED